MTAGSPSLEVGFLVQSGTNYKEDHMERTLHRALTIDQARIEILAEQIIPGDRPQMIVRVEALNKPVVEFWVEQGDFGHLATLFAGAANRTHPSLG
jgi:hypothetical protein